MSVSCTLRETFWSAPLEAHENTPEAVVCHALACLNALEVGDILSPESGAPVSLKELMAQLSTDVGKGYAPPELAPGEALTDGCLVFAVAALVRERLTGRGPCGSEAAGLHPPVPEAELPDLLGQILRRAMQPSPDQRYASLNELKQALRDFGGDRKVGPRPKFFDAPTPQYPSSLAVKFLDAPTEIGGPTNMEQGAGLAPSATVTDGDVLEGELGWQKPPEGLEDLETDQLIVVESLSSDSDTADQTIESPRPLEALFDDITQEGPATKPNAPLGDSTLVKLTPVRVPVTPPPVVAGSARRPESSPSSASRLMPLVHALLGAGVASAFFMVYKPWMPKPASVPEPARHVRAAASQPASAPVRAEPPADAAIATGLADSAVEVDAAIAVAGKRPARVKAPASRPAPRPRRVRPVKEPKVVEPVKEPGAVEPVEVPQPKEPVKAPPARVRQPKWLEPVKAPRAADAGIRPRPARPDAGRPRPKKKTAPRPDATR